MSWRALGVPGGKPMDGRESAGGEAEKPLSAKKRPSAGNAGTKRARGRRRGPGFCTARFVARLHSGASRLWRERHQSDAKLGHTATERLVQRPQHLTASAAERAECGP